MTASRATTPATAAAAASRPDATASTAATGAAGTTGATGAPTSGPSARPAALPIQKSIVVAASAERAFRVFTEAMSTWWPLTSYHIGKVDAASVVMEPFAGGRWFERGVDGSECDWGRVLAWDPPRRLVLTWSISSEWRYDPSVRTEVEVRFHPEGPDGAATRVDLEHRLLHYYGEKAAEMRGIFDSNRGWNALLEAFAARAAAA